MEQLANGPIFGAGEALPSLSVVILAGGYGRRLGRDKAALLLGGETLLERAIRRMAWLSDDLVVVTRPDQELAASTACVVHDRPGQSGVLAGIAAGLAASSHAWAFVVACDMPFVNLDLVRYLAGLAAGYDIVVPRLPQGLEPLHALYSQCCLAAVERALYAGQQRVISFYPEVRVRYVSPDAMAPLDPELRSFFNINTPENLDQAQDWLRGGDAGT